MAMNVEALAAKYYAGGLWSLAQLEALVAKGKLTHEAVLRIIGADDDDAPEEAEGE